MTSVRESNSLAKNPPIWRLTCKGGKNRSNSISAILPFSHFPFSWQKNKNLWKSRSLKKEWKKLCLYKNINKDRKTRIIISEQCYQPVQFQVLFVYYRPWNMDLLHLEARPCNKSNDQVVSEINANTLDEGTHFLNQRLLQSM